MREIQITGRRLEDGWRVTLADGTIISAPTWRDICETLAEIVPPTVARCGGEASVVHSVWRENPDGSMHGARYITTCDRHALAVEDLIDDVDLHCDVSLRIAEWPSMAEDAQTDTCEWTAHLPAELLR